MTTAICSVYFDNIHPRMLDLHRQAVLKLMPKDATYYQLRATDHGSAMFRMAKNLAVTRSNHDFNRIVFLDIDCIPLNRQALVEPFKRSDLWGCAQRANHIENGAHIYASPFAMGFTLDLFDRMNYPTFSAAYRGDVGEELTYAYERLHGGARPYLLFPSDVETMPEGGYWALENGKQFGLGTTYANEEGSNYFYHAFQIRMGDAMKRFESKCREVLG